MASITSMSSLSLFSNWVSKHTTWAELKVWLQAEEPGIDIIESEDSAYAILRNSKDKDGEAALAEDAISETAQLCRSVIWDTESNLPCCVAPFAARRNQKIPTEACEASGPGLRIEDFVEGVMVNVFRARGDAETHVTTRSRLDADGTFYSERSFRELFEEAMDEKKTSLDYIERLIGEPNESVAATFITLVLAHPEHRVVRTVEKANFWAVYRGSVANDGTVTFYTEDLPAAWRPKVYSMDFKGEFADLKAKFEEIKATKPWYWQGLVVHSGLQRWRFRNAEHDRVRKDLRGTESNSFGRFLRLRAQRRIQEYLRIYKEDSQEFDGFEQEYRSATKTLYNWYCKVHKEHSLVFKSLPKSVQPLVFDTHKFYLTALRPANKSLHLAELISWVPEYLKTQYGISNFIRFTKETEQPTSGIITSVVNRRVTVDGEGIQVTIDVPSSTGAGAAGTTGAAGATAPVSPVTEGEKDSVAVVEAV
jgi:hypothetical protein